jgi:hypothetical protein
MKKVFILGLILQVVWLLFMGAFSNTVTAAEGWILWQSTPNRTWLVVAGYSDYEQCRKDLAKKDDYYRGLAFVNVDVVGHEWAPKVGDTETPDLTSVTGYYCLPSNFHPKEEN